jgi:hypothetical protein
MVVVVVVVDAPGRLPGIKTSPNLIDPAASTR